MGKKRHAQIIACKYLRWRLYKRGRLYWADGRSNTVDAGRHPLSTANYDEALEAIHQLDAVRAVNLGLADACILQEIEDNEIDFDTGTQLYLKHVGRPAVMSGPRPVTKKRYRAVLQKAVPFFKKQGLLTWNQLKLGHLESYAAWLDGEQYAYATEFLEITTIKQTINYLIKAGHLPKKCKIESSMPKPTDTDTYCYSGKEVAAMIECCRSDSRLNWLGDVIIGLGCTGMRISELASRRWGDIDFDLNVIRLVDESRTKKARHGTARTTKTGHSRSFPIQKELRAVLERLYSQNREGPVFRAARGGILRPDNVRHMLIKYVITPLKGRFPCADGGDGNVGGGVNVSSVGDVGFAQGRLHSLRHFFCSMCANQGIPELMLMRWLGHRSSGMIKRYYHLNDPVSQQHMKNLKFPGGTDAT